MDRDDIDQVSKELEEMKSPTARGDDINRPFLEMEEGGKEESGINREKMERGRHDTARRAAMRSYREAARRTRHSSGRLIRPSDGMVAAFCVPVVIMVIIFAQRGIFPFGEESFLRTDMYHQYAPFFSEFQYKLSNGRSLLYSWNIGMGVNFAALYAYYLASPLNWLIVLFSKGLVIEFMTYMIVLKVGLSGLSFAYYLRKHSKTSDFGVAFFGIFYALSGYMAAYSWNIMWLDCILLFPLIVLGLERLVKKKKCLLYCVTLGLSILSNYYISIMICLFAVLYFIALLVLEGKKPFKDYAVNFFQFGLYSLVAGALAAVVLLPEIYALQTTASGDFSFPKTVDSYFPIFDMVARHIGNVESEIGLDHWPNIYCGVAVFVFFLLYLASKKVAAKEKAVYCGLLLIFFASFSVNTLNFIWHGFHYPNSLPARQSFIYIFLMLLISYRAYMNLKYTPVKHITLAFLGSVGFVILAEKLVTEEHFHFWMFYVAIIFLAMYTGVIYLYKKGVSRNVLVLFALGLVAVESAVNMTITSVTTTSRTSYVSDNQASIKLTSELTPSEEFFRVEKVTRKTKNDGAWMNFPSVSLFSSTANADLTAFFKKLGCEGSTNAYSITGSTPLADSLFSVKYGLYSKKPKDTGLITLLGEERDMSLYVNSYTLPLGFVMPSQMEEHWDLSLGNPADVQNDLANVIGAMPVLYVSPGDIRGTSFTFTPEVSGDYYVYVKNKEIKEVSATIGDETKNFDNLNRGFFMELGYCEAGIEVRLQSDEAGQDLVAEAYRFSPEGLQSVYEELNQFPLKLTRWSDTRLEGTVESTEGGVLYTSIPFDKGWTVYVDGVKADTEKVFDTFLGIRLSPGSHTIRLSYMAEGLIPGSLLTAGAVCFLVGAGLLHRRGIRIKLKKKQEN